MAWNNLSPISRNVSLHVFFFLHLISLYFLLSLPLILSSFIFLHLIPSSPLLRVFVFLISSQRSLQYSGAVSLLEQLMHQRYLVIQQYYVQDMDKVRTIFILTQSLSFLSSLASLSSLVSLASTDLSYPLHLTV